MTPRLWLWLGKTVGDTLFTLWFLMLVILALGEEKHIDILGNTLWTRYPRTMAAAIGLAIFIGQLLKDSFRIYNFIRERKIP